MSALSLACVRVVTDLLFRQNDLDALILPTSQSAGVAAIAGYPVVTVPLGYYPSTTNTTYNSRGTLTVLGPNYPFGLSFIGRRFSEEKLIAYAYAFEQKTKVRSKVDPFVRFAWALT